MIFVSFSIRDGLKLLQMHGWFSLKGIALKETSWGGAFSGGAWHSAERAVGNGQKSYALSGFILNISLQNWIK